jgi:P27 family predicted phage terminase small subunit
MRGRKPKPTHLKLVTGNPGRRPLNAREPKPEISIPPVPAELCDDAKEEWARVSVELHRAGMLTTVDRGVLAAYCQAYGRFITAERMLRKLAEKNPATQGLIIKTTNGNAIQNPLIGIANKAHNDMVRYAVEFGMTPSARSRIQVGNAQAEDDVAFQFLD